MNFKQFVKENRMVIIFSSLMVAGIVILPQFGHAQVTNYEKPQEDQVLVCVSAEVIDSSGELCRTFNVDGDGYYQREVTLDEAQRELYFHPQEDTFIMDLRD